MYYVDSGTQCFVFEVWNAEEAMEFEVFSFLNLVFLYAAVTDGQWCCYIMQVSIGQVHSMKVFEFCVAQNDKSLYTVMTLHCQIFWYIHGAANHGTKFQLPRR